MESNHTTYFWVSFMQTIVKCPTSIFSDLSCQRPNMNNGISNFYTFPQKWSLTLPPITIQISWQVRVVFQVFVLSCLWEFPLENIGVKLGSKDNILNWRISLLCMHVLKAKVLQSISYIFYQEWSICRAVSATNNHYKEL